MHILFASNVITSLHRILILLSIFVSHFRTTRRNANNSYPLLEYGSLGDNLLVQDE